MSRSWGIPPSRSATPPPQNYLRYHHDCVHLLAKGNPERSKERCTGCGGAVAQSVSLSAGHYFVVVPMPETICSSTDSRSDKLLVVRACKVPTRHNCGVPVSPIPMPIKPLAVSTQFSDFLKKHGRVIQGLRQNWLLSESQFLSFARDRGLRVQGAINGEPGKFHKEGLLSADARLGQDLQFHPFRFYVLRELMSNRESFIEKNYREWNEIADLAIILEPIYWPRIISKKSFPGRMDDHDSRLEKYRKKVFRIVASLDSEKWEHFHADLRRTAAWFEPNGELYLLLRVTLWDRRSALTGALSGALWIRHMAEVIRRGFEAVTAKEWHEEDRAFGHWHPTGRIRLYGSERPLDDSSRSKPHLARRFGLFTGSVVRWYVEGETEYHAVQHLLPDPSRLAVELVNLRGEIAKEKANAARKLEDAVREDLDLRRFSMISFDWDVASNRRAIGQLARENLVVGTIFAHRPDFEFANFHLDELVEVAATLDDRHGFGGDILRKADWTSVTTAKEFADKYKTVSERRRALKGKEWGEALAEYAAKHRKLRGDDFERPILRAGFAAAWAWHSDYGHRAKNFTIDPTTFQDKPVETP